MSILLGVFSFLAFAMGWLTLLGSKSAIHEIAAFVLFAIFAIFFSGAAIVNAIDKTNKK